MDNGGGDGIGCFDIAIGVDAASEVHECENSRIWIVQVGLFDQRKWDVSQR